MYELFLEGLRRLNVVLTSAAVLMGFSLMAYLFVYNVRNRVARAFLVVLACLTVSYLGDLFLATARLPASHPAAAFWLGLGWLGICFVAPAYLHFADTVADTVGAPDRRRKWLVRASAAGAAGCVLLVLGTDWLVGSVWGEPGAVRFAARPLFPVFGAWYLALTAWGGLTLWQARRHAYTSQTRRRMTYLLASIIAPLSTFPYLMAGGQALADNTLLFRVLASVGSLAATSMLVVMTYSVAYHGALIPDRAVKRDLIKYLIQAPTLGVFIIALVQVVPLRLETSLGLPRDVVVALAIVLGVVGYQFVVRLLKPAVDLMVFGGEGGDVQWLQRLDERLLSEHDLIQLLERILTTLCERLRVTTGCVVVLEGDAPRVDVFVGAEARALDALGALDPERLAALAGRREAVAVDGFWLRGLAAPGGTALLGILAVEQPVHVLDPADQLAVNQLMESAEVALQDRVVQRRVLATLRALEPEILSMQRLRGALQTGTVRVASPVSDPDFPHWVRDALAHYWGGPKLTSSRPKRRPGHADGHQRGPGTVAPRRPAQLHRQRVAAVQHPRAALRARPQGPRYRPAPGHERVGPVPQTAHRHRCPGPTAGGHGGRARQRGRTARARLA
jgi:hypothetical protein